MTDAELWERYRKLNRQQYLPFDFIIEEEQEKKRKEEEQKTEEAKKKMMLPHYDQPRNDNEKLLNLQWEYKNGRTKALDEIFTLSKTIAWKYINTIVRTRKKVKNTPILDREIKAGNAASYIVEQYIIRPDFQINTSMTSYIYLRVIKELFYHTKAEKLQDFVDIDRFYKEGTEEEITEWEARIIK